MNMRPRASAVGAFVFVSGLAGLSYEIIFARYLGLFLGHEAHAVVAVLAAFMGGLALGNMWLGSRADRASNALAFYGRLEIGIGLYGLFFPALHAGGRHLFLLFARFAQPVVGGSLTFKFAFAGLLILLPAMLMGGTLPALVRFSTHSMGELRERVATLYFLNSLGAVVGCFAADFWWIPQFGLPSAVMATGILNLLAGTLALVLSRHRGPPDPVRTPPLRSSEVEIPASAGALRMAAVCIGISGFVAMLYEVSWTRLLALALGSTTHAFSLMLAAFIGGIAAGAWFISRHKSTGRDLSAFAWIELMLGTTVLISLFAYQYLPYAFVKGANLLARDPRAYWLYVMWQVVLCFCVMFVPAVFLGMTLPLVTRAAAVDLKQAGRGVGRIFAFNTYGAVIGAVATGLWLMPGLGLARTFGVGIAANLAVGIFILSAGKWPEKRARYFAVPALFVGLAWWCGLQFNDTWQRSLTLGLWREPNSLASLSEFQNVAGENHLKFYRDGAAATVSVNAWEQQGSEQMNLRVNGKPDASTAGDMATQLLLGHLPFLLRPQSERALVIGLGSGATCGAIACHATLKELDVVEISAEVVSAARLFSGYNHHVLDDPRLCLTIDDARSFLEISDRKFDVIASEPSNPWIAGVAGVFTREFYEVCRGHLRPDGVMVQWLHLYDNSEEALDLVLRTYSSVFPSVTVWQSEELDVILVGSVRPLKTDLAALMARFDEAAVQTDLARIHLNRLPVLLSREIVSEQNGRFLCPAEGAVQTDLRPALEYAAQRAFFVHREATSWLQFDENLSSRAGTLLADFLRNHPLTSEDYRGFVDFYLTYRLPRAELMRSLCLRWQGELGSGRGLIEWLPRLPPLGAPGEFEALRLTPLREEIFKVAEKNPGLLRYYAKLLMQIYRAQRSIFHLPHGAELEAALERLLITDPADRPFYQLQMAELAWDHGDTDGCIRWSQSALSMMPITVSVQSAEFVAGLARLADALRLAGKTRESAAVCEDARRAGCRDPILEMARRRALAAGSNFSP